MDSEIRPRPIDRRFWAVPAVAASTSALLLATSGRYGWHRDELYFLACGRHLAWGFVDQGPLVPFVARVADSVAPGNLLALRFLPALGTGVTVFLGAALAAELGASRRARVLAAVAVGSAGFVLGAGHLLSTATFDFTAWMAVLVLFARMLRTRDARLWIAIGVVAGLAMLNKALIPLLILSLVAALLVTGNAALVVDRWAAAGAALAILVAGPYLLWQARNGWPQFEMAGALSARLATFNRVALVPGQALFLAPLLIPLLWRGAQWLRAGHAGSRFRPLLWAWPIALVAVFASGGRPYYPLPLTATVLIAGLVASDQAGRSHATTRLLALNAAVMVVFALPVLPEATLPTTRLAALNETTAEMIGWHQLVGQVAAAVHELPTAEQADVVILTGSYGEAGAIDLFGPGAGLPPAYSPHNSYGYFRRPTDDTATVLAVRIDPPYLARYFENCTRIDTVRNSLGIANEVSGQPISVCRGLRGTWATLWPQMRFLA